MSSSLSLAEQIKAEARKELARRDFWQFCLWYDHDFFVKRTFLKMVADAFMRVHRGEAMRIAVSMPPRAGKSYITSLFCAWTLGKNPQDSIMRNTCTARLYEKFSYDVRGILRNDKFKAVFPDAALSPDKQSVNGWNLITSRQVGYFGAGVGGTIIGFGATKLAITDDLYKSMQDALSEVVNEKVLSWTESAHGSRLEKNCPQIDIGTRWTGRDIIGNNIEHGRYSEVVIIPALNAEDQSFCEDVKTTAEYLSIRADIDETIWNAEYMQQPIEAKGLLFPAKELRYFTPSDVLDKSFMSSIGYTDVADEGDDNLSSPIGRNIGSNIYITDLVFNTLNSDITIPLVADMLRRHKVSYNRVESNSMGAMYSRELQKTIKTCQVYPAVSTTNKHTRILMDAGFIKRHCLFLAPEYQSDEYRLFMKELTSYLKTGTSKHDDAPDSMSGLVIFIRAILPHLYQ